MNGVPILIAEGFLHAAVTAAVVVGRCLLHKKFFLSSFVGNVGDGQRGFPIPLL